MQNRMELVRKLSLRLTGRPGSAVNLRCGMAIAILASLVQLAAGQKVTNSAEQPPGVRSDRIGIPSPVNQPPDAVSQTEMRGRTPKAKNLTAVNLERRRQIAADTARLIKLAEDLKTQLESASNDALSMTLVNQAAEIEKLAHEVKEKMKLTLGER
jgi:hypothetical protein